MKEERRGGRAINDRSTFWEGGGTIEIDIGKKKKVWRGTRESKTRKEARRLWGKNRKGLAYFVKRGGGSLGNEMENEKKISTGRKRKKDLSFGHAEMPRKERKGRLATMV